MDVSAASFVPRRVTGAAEAAEAVAVDGAAIVTGLADEAAAVRFGGEVMGGRCVRIGTQFEATQQGGELGAMIVAAQPRDERGRKRDFGTAQERMTPHNDGYAFGDFAPDHLFLWCERPSAAGGDSFLIDGVRLLELLEAEPAHRDLVSFCRTVDIDHSEPNFPQGAFAPVARQVPSGRPQVRYHPYLAPVAGPREAEQWPWVNRWSEAVLAARDTGPMFRVEAGEMICIDNYRILHGRDGYDDPARRVCSIWGWSTDAVAIPRGALDINVPDIAAAAG
ncbi:TauD/TfdA family dioxygenase [Streptomyces sp.]|uniref:TauD/TfdA family dioxygenase n=1 Tax=Streptomyces sp. TaxID=1931 RepID=UPI002F40B506